MQTSGQLIRHDIIQSRFLGRNRTIVFNPSGNQVLLDSGEFINTHTLQPSNRLSSELDAAVWMGDRLFTAKAMARGVRVTRWGGTNYGQDAVIEAPGSDPHLFVSADGELILVTRAIDRTVFSLFDENLNPIFRQSHRGADLLDDTVRLSNLSTRVNLPAANDNPLVVGFVIRGDSPMRVLLRAIGPGLAQFGIDDHVADPQIRVYDSSAEIVTVVDDWSAETAAGIESAAVAVGAFPLKQGSGDAAIVLTLPPGPYTAQVSRARGSGRNVLFEVYDYSEAGTTSRLVNLSTRTDAGSGDDALVAGFVVSGGAAQSLLMRAVGGALQEFGVTNPMADPVLTVRDSTQAIEAQNDNWVGNAYVKEAAAFAGAFPLSASYRYESALLSELPPGPHTATVTSAEPDDFGNVLIEIYQTDN